MEFEGRKKGKYEGAKKFIEKMKEIQEEAKATLGKVQEEMKKYADKKRGVRGPLTHDSGARCYAAREFSAEM